MSGRLRNQVTIQAQATTQDSHGQRNLTWSDVETVWAHIKPLQGADFYNQSGEHAQVTHEVLLRDEVTVVPGNRIKYGTRYFDVRAVLNVAERGAWLNLRVVEVVS